MIITVEFILYKSKKSITIECDQIRKCLENNRQVTRKKDDIHAPIQSPKFSILL